MSALSDWFKDRRRDLGFSQATIGKNIGMNQAQISNIESGKLIPDVNTMAKIDAVLGKFSGSYVPVQNSHQKQFPEKAKEALRLYREAKENNFCIKIDDTCSITADRNAYILKQGTSITYFSEIKSLIKFLVVSQVRQSAVNSVQEISNRLDEIYGLIEERFNGYDPAGISELSATQEE